MGIDRVGSCIRKNKVKVMMMMDEIEKEKKEAKNCMNKENQKIVQLMKQWKWWIKTTGDGGRGMLRECRGRRG